MPYDDGRNGARARSARIRSSHDYEATQLEAMRRRTASPEARPARVPLVARLSAVFARRRPVAELAEPDAMASAGHAE